MRYNEPSYRHFGGRGINFIIQALILPGLNDTQCGFKCFRADVAEEIFSLGRELLDTLGDRPVGQPLRVEFYSLSLKDGDDITVEVKFSAE